jgi:hypothetical protein
MTWREIGWSTGVIVGTLGVIYARLQAIGLGRARDDVRRRAIGFSCDASLRADYGQSQKPMSLTLSDHA